MSIRLGDESEEDRDENIDLQNIVQEFLYTCDGVFSVQLQKLCYAGDLYAVERYEKRLTQTDYHAYKYGPYSDAVKKALDKLAAEHPDVTTKPASRNGKPDDKYISESSPPDLNEDRKDVIRRICDGLGNLSTKELTAFSKNTTPYQSTLGGETIDFVEYAGNIPPNPEEDDLSLIYPKMRSTENAPSGLLDLH